MLMLLQLTMDVFMHICMVSAGSDPVGMKCKAERVDGGYVLNGNKMWCSNGGIADTLVRVYLNTFI